VTWLFHEKVHRVYDKSWTIPGCVNQAKRQSARLTNWSPLPTYQSPNILQWSLPSLIMLKQEDVQPRWLIRYASVPAILTLCLSVGRYLSCAKLCGLYRDQRPLDFKMASRVTHAVAARKQHSNSHSYNNMSTLWPSWCYLQIVQVLVMWHSVKTVCATIWRLCHQQL